MVCSPSPIPLLPATDCGDGTTRLISLEYDTLTHLCQLDNVNNSQMGGGGWIKMKRKRILLWFIGTYVLTSISYVTFQFARQGQQHSLTYALSVCLAAVKGQTKTTAYLRKG